MVTKDTLELQRKFIFGRDMLESEVFYSFRNISWLYCSGFFFFNLTQASVIWEEESLNWENASQDSHVDKYVVQFLDW